MRREYAEREGRFGSLFTSETALWNRIANLRLLAFILFAVGVGVGLWLSLQVLVFAGVLFFAAFIGLVAYHRVVSRRRRRFEELWRINQEALWRIDRDWGSLPLRHTVRVSPDDPYAGDLDIFGHASLFHLLDTLTTHEGEAALASWLSGFARPEVVRHRQEAVAELAPLVEFRDELELCGRLISAERPDSQRFLAWAESEPWLAHRPWLQWLAILSPILLWVLVLAQVLGVVSYPWWTTVAVLNMGLAFAAGRWVSPLISQAAREGGFRYYTPAFELMCAQPFHSEPLARLKANLGCKGTPDEVSAPLYARRLFRLTNLVLPTSAVMYVVIQAVTLWDIHLLGALERWQRKAGSRARGWLESLGEIEALSALARLSHDNPGWAFPSVDMAAAALEARELGHPLLRHAQRVDNDVAVGPPGTFLLVTGSNMSGKSTLLRAIGANAVLAGAGGPSCAASLRLPPVDLWTSMRVEDSLERGVSYYMAELQRLKRVVDAARLDQNTLADGRRLLYLLDEILQGTNTFERQIAARRVILYLAGQGAIGAVSTHDLTLADEPEVAAIARPVHFTETLNSDGNGPAMSFDYKLRAGIATSTNALRLLEIVGIDLANGVGTPPASSDRRSPNQAGAVPGSLGGG